jgi:hypothetical protein
VTVGKVSVYRSTLIPKAPSAHSPATHHSDTMADSAPARSVALSTRRHVASFVIPASSSHSAGARPTSSTDVAFTPPMSATTSAKSAG